MIISPSSIITWPLYYPGLYNESQSQSSWCCDEGLTLSHTHESVKDIKERVFNLCTNKSDEEAEIIIKKMQTRVKNCLSFIQRLMPEKETAENAKLRAKISEEIQEDTDIAIFLDTTLINLALFQKREKNKSKRFQTKNHKCVMM